MSFSFSFSGDDIEAEGAAAAAAPIPPSAAPAGAFPVAGKPLLPAVSHDLKQMLADLPSKVAYGLLDVDLDGAGSLQLPRRELWDVRVQLMAEDSGEGESEPGLGSHDVRTGVYEGGFKSWESSVDLVKVLAQIRQGHAADHKIARVVELGCGTALPSLALFHWALSAAAAGDKGPFSLVLADYNPTVLQLVTLPNIILSWALHQQSQLEVLAEAFSAEGELELSPEVVKAFEDFIAAHDISLHFFSGAWSEELVALMTREASFTGQAGSAGGTVILGAETIYSPFALDSFTQIIFALMRAEKAQGQTAEVLVGAKKLYFGVGGSLDDFVSKARDLGAQVDHVREETDGVRRGVVRCSLAG